MKVLFITDNFPPENNAPATRTYEHCKRWVNNCLDITVITCFPNFPKGKVFDGFKNKIIETSEVEKIKLIRVWSYMTKNEGFLRRILDYLSFSFTSFIAGLFREFDVVVSTSPQFFTSFTGFLLKLFRRKKWIFEVRDLWPDTIAAVGSINRHSFLYKILETIELFFYAKADMIIVVTSSFKKDLIERGVNKDKIHIIYNGIDDVFSKNKINKSRLEIRQNLKINDKVVIGYIGTVGMTHDLISTVKQLKNLPAKYHLLIVGEGAAKREIFEFVKSNKLKNITLLDSITKESVPSFINAIDLSLIQLKKCDTFKNVIPSKIFENAAMGKTIILGVEGESKNIIEKYKLGLSFEPGNFNSFISALDKSELFKSENRVEFLKEFSRDSQAKKMCNLLKRI
jgi:glycosyltransferase involved in cell wall biosynthesis